MTEADGQNLGAARRERAPIARRIVPSDRLVPPPIDQQMRALDDQPSPLLAVTTPTTAADPWAERYREQVRLTGNDVPNRVLDQLDTAWPARKRWSLVQMVDVEVADDEALNRIEAGLRRQAAVEAADRGRCLLSTTGPQWVQRPDFGHDLGPDFTRETPWQRGTPLHEWATALVCRMSGLSIPLLAEEA